MSLSIPRNRWFVQLTWGVLLFNILLVFIVPTDAFRSLLPALAYLVWLTFTSLLAVTGLVFIYRHFFHSWFGWGIVVLLVILSFFFILGIKIEQPQLSFFFSMMLLPSLWILFLATLIFLWQRDVGMPIVGLLSISLVWALFLYWHYEGDIVTLWLYDLNHPTEPSPLWWLNTLFCLSSCIVPIAMISFLFHTFRLIKHEIE